MARSWHWRHCVLPWVSHGNCRSHGPEAAQREGPGSAWKRVHGKTATCDLGEPDPSLSLSFALFVSLSLALSLFRSRSLSLSLWLSVSLRRVSSSFSLWVSSSVSYLSLSLSLCLLLSLPLSLNAYKWYMVKNKVANEALSNFHS